MNASYATNAETKAKKRLRMGRAASKAARDALASSGPKRYVGGVGGWPKNGKPTTLFPASVPSSVTRASRRGTVCAANAATAANGVMQVRTKLNAIPVAIMSPDQYFMRSPYAEQAAT